MNLKELFGVGTKLKESYSRTTTKSILRLQPEHGFCQPNGPNRGQIQDWYPNDFGLQGVWVLYRIEGDDSLPLLAFRKVVVNAIFLKYLKEGR